MRDDLVVIGVRTIEFGCDKFGVWTDEGMPPGSPYAWRKVARANGRRIPNSDNTPEGRSSQDKFAAVLETAALNETELGEYCRKRGLYPEQI
ncbi:MAG: hypothetical protein ACI8W7_001826 [Gammaproteobacteria bacterium]